MKNIKKLLLVLLFVGFLYLTTYLSYELNPKDWYSLPTLFISLSINGVSFYLVGKEFIN